VPTIKTGLDVLTIINVRTVEPKKRQALVSLPTGAPSGACGICPASHPRSRRRRLLAQQVAKRMPPIPKVSTSRFLPLMASSAPRARPKTQIGLMPTSIPMPSPTAIAT
jgi:hypothetical protein